MFQELKALKYTANVFVKLADINQIVESQFIPTNNTPM